jgi:hypothetical protein
MPADTSQVRERALPGQILRQQERIRSKAAPAPEPEPSPPTVPEAKANEPAPPEPLVPPAPPAPKVDPRKSDPAYWEQRFKVTQGILSQAREEHAAQVEELRTRIAELQSQLAKATPANELDLGQFFTPEQIEQHGEAQCQAMASTAIKAARSQAQTLIDAEIAPLKTARADDVKRARDQRLADFKERLAELAPDWQEIDKDPRWTDPNTGYLAEVDPASGLQRQDILNMHIASFNARGAAQVFDAFRAAHETQRPPVPPAGNVRVGGPPPPPAPSQGYPSKADIREHYRRRALKQVSDAEHATFEARLQSRATA